MISIALMCSASVSSQAPLVIKPSMAWGQRIHAGGGLQRLRHGGHQLAVDDGDQRDVMRVDADELAALFLVGDDVVDGHLGGGAGSGRQRDDRHRRLLGRRHAFKAAHVGKFWVVGDDADRLGGILRRAAADGNEIVGLGLGEGGDAILDDADGRVGHHLVEQLVGKAGGVEQARHLGHRTGLDQHRVGHHQRLPVAAALHLADQLGTSTGAEIGRLVENHAMGHAVFLLRPVSRHVDGCGARGRVFAGSGSDARGSRGRSRGQQGAATAVAKIFPDTKSVGWLNHNENYWLVRTLTTSHEPLLFD